MKLFMRELIEKLNHEDKGWRRTTMLIWDGAGYHRASGTIQLLKE
jgi:hypothetical protein